MMNSDERDELLARVQKNKRTLRREVAQLPILEKLRILVEMQRNANLIRKSRGREPRAEWDIEA
jgi:hypothetical protein